MKRVLAGVGVVAAIMAASTGIAAAGAAVAPVAGPAVGSTEDFPGAALFQALGLGSSQPCDGIMLDTCLPTGPASTRQGFAQPVADSGSGLLNQDINSVLGYAIGWLANGSSEPCYSFGPNCAWE
ncbi:hypothetical protein [Nocardia caishijiensis]|uniref:Secreted protein n=1 Tax=Nocardia caishijiensis TaxID=184756 RepID=A0ABQ6YS07_9NOCA|nr:hypothetical protein [Nocardia caishijiensis]KAF0848418.1 hypothetical protein FNL39_102567 [Nocardia caishijiensis]